MNKIIVAIMYIGFSLFLTTTTASATSSAKKGQKIFKKNFRKYCRFSGVKFACNHTQDEWEEIWDEGKFQAESLKICPKLKVKKIKPKWWKDVYEFSYKYASDGVVPKC